MAATLVGAPSTARSAGSTDATALSTAQLAGQRVIYSYRGLTPPASLLSRIRAGEAAGVIFFGSNIAGPSQIAAVTAELQRAAEQGPLKEPLLLMVDQEGGAVRRLAGGPLSSEQQIGAAADPLLAAEQAGRAAGRTLTAAGMNVNLAPVLDVARSSTGFIQHFGRSYGSDPALAGRLGARFVTAQQATGVAATAKHFPGLGEATRSQNTDERPVRLPALLSTLRSIDEAPFRAAIRAGVRLVMVSWATYPAVDATRPAGLSRSVVRGELRRRLHFTGVTITDALDAGALRAYGGISSRAVRAADAGMDLLLCTSGSIAEADGARRALAVAMRSGRLRRSVAVAAVHRVLALRSSVR